MFAIAGCGGGGGGGAGSGGGVPMGGTGSGETSTALPASALQSVDAFVAYMKQLVASTSDTSEPVQLGDAVLPVSDTTETAGP